MPRNCLHDPTRIDLLFTMSEIPQTASHWDNRCKAMFRGRIVLKPCARQAIVSIKPSGGARRDRTDDLMLAKHALSQLSYGPVPEDEWFTSAVETHLVEEKTRSIKVVGLGRLELPTSRLSSARSNQLSYKPELMTPPGEDSARAGLSGKKE